jgi:hypothetical protein
VLLAAICIVGLWIFSRKGSAAKVGANMDKVGERINDAVSPSGPIEKAGKKLDKVLEDVNDLGR